MEPEKRKDAILEAEEHAKLVNSPDEPQKVADESSDSSSGHADNGDTAMPKSSLDGHEIQATASSDKETNQSDNTLKPELSSSSAGEKNAAPSEKPVPAEKTKQGGVGVLLLRFGAAIIDASIIGILSIIWLFVSTAAWQISLSGRAGIPWTPLYVLSMSTMHAVAYTWIIGIGAALWPVASPLVGMAAALSNPTLRIINPESFWMAIGNVCLAPLLIDLIYRISMERSSLKGTLGKRVFGLEVTNSTGNKMSLLLAVTRYFTRIVSIAPFWAGVTYALFDKDRRVFHDRLTNTWVKPISQATNVARRAPWAFLVCGLFLTVTVNFSIPAILFPDRHVGAQDESLFAVLRRCHTHIQTEQWQKAQDMAETVLKDRPENVQAHMYSGIALRELKRYQESVDQANKILAIDPYSAAAYCLRAAALERLDKPEDALKDYTAAAFLNPRHAESHTRRAILLNKLNRFDEAAKEAEQALTFDPNSVEAQSALGTANARLCRWAEATTALQAAFSQSTGKKRRAFLKQLGVCQYGAGQYKEARKSFSLGFKLETPGESTARADCLRWVAECDLLLKDWTGAEEALKPAVDLTPHDGTLFYLQSCVSYLKGDDSAARAQAKKAFAEGLKGPDADAQRDILTAINEPDRKKSLELFEAALKRSPEMHELPLLKEQAVKAAS